MVIVKNIVSIVLMSMVITPYALSMNHAPGMPPFGEELARQLRDACPLSLEDVNDLSGHDIYNALCIVANDNAQVSFLNDELYKKLRAYVQHMQHNQSSIDVSKILKALNSQQAIPLAQHCIALGIITNDQFEALFSQGSKRVFTCDSDDDDGVAVSQQAVGVTAPGGKNALMARIAQQRAQKERQATTSAREQGQSVPHRDPSDGATLVCPALARRGPLAPPMDVSPLNDALSLEDVPGLTGFSLE